MGQSDKVEEEIKAMEQEVLGTVGIAGPVGVEGPTGSEPAQTVELNYAVAEEPPQPEVGEGGAAQVPALHVASARAFGSASLHAREFGCGVITVTYDAAGAYRIQSEGINVTYVIGFLQRAILSLQASASDRSPFAG